MPNIKITAVGGGSYSWGPGLLGNLLGNRDLDGCHVTLYDLNPEAVDLVYRLACRYKEITGSRITFEKSTDQAAALDGAGYVLVTISTGGLATMRPDLEIPEKYGIFQTVGDTVGPGGLSRALRNVPVFLRLARAMEQRCPNAWMLNFSNPLCAITRAVNKETSIRALGLCHGVINVAREYAAFFGATLSDCHYVNTGIDHFSWFTEFRVKGRRVFDALGEMGVEEWLALSPAQAKEHPVFGKLFRLRNGIALGRVLGVLPAIGDRHLVEFLPTYLQGRTNVEKYGLVRTTADDRAQGNASARARIERMLAGQEKLAIRQPTDVIGDRLSDDVAAWIAALEGGRAIEDNLNVPNVGQIPQLPLGAIVETRGVLDGTGVRPIASPLPKVLEALAVPHVLREELTVEAAVQGSFEKALQVLATDPLLSGIETARPMLRELLAANRDWLSPGLQIAD